MTMGNDACVESEVVATKIGCYGLKGEHPTDSVVKLIMYSIGSVIDLKTNPGLKNALFEYLW